MNVVTQDEIQDRMAKIAVHDSIDIKILKHKEIMRLAMKAELEILMEVNNKKGICCLCGKEEPDILSIYTKSKVHTSCHETFMNKYTT